MPDIRQTGYLDDFQRGAEYPLSYGGRWLPLFVLGNTYINLDQNSAELWGISGGSVQSSYWDVQSFSGDCEVWGRASTGHDLREGLRIYMHMTQPYGRSGTNGACGYRASCSAPVLGGAGHAIERIDSYADPVLLASADGFFPQWILLRRIGSTLELWLASDNPPTNWTLSLTADDSTYNYGYFGIGTQQDDYNPSWIGFGGGQIHHTEFYRWVKA